MLSTEKIPFSKLPGPAAEALIWVVKFIRSPSEVVSFRSFSEYKFKNQQVGVKLSQSIKVSK